MSSAAVGSHHHSGAGPLSLMSCVRESSPLQDYEPPDTEKNSATKRKFWNPRKWFKRKNKTSEEVVPVEIVDKDDFRSRSTSELSITEDQIKRRSGSSMHPGLSVSHDSVFHSPNSGSDIELDAAQSSSSLSISQPQIDLRLQTELSERLRLRRGRGDTSEDDEGLPHSPCNSPTTTDALLEKTAIKDLPTKSHSTCSDGSLLSMGSSEMDEESISQQSRHSSKLSLQEKRLSDQESDFELGPSSSSTPLNHSAAHHRVSVRPKRRAPHRSRRVPQLSNALPTTPEVNEESSVRSMTPENISKEILIENYSMSTKTTLTETQLKCSSLPPGLAAPGGDTSTKLNRSRSNAGSKSQEQFTTLEEDVEKEEKTDKSFFDRIFPRRSAKKRKSKEEKPTLQTTSYSKQMVESSYSKRVESKPIAAPRSGAASRQRIQPIDLPPSPEVQKKDMECIMPKPSPEKSFAGTSPLHLELENRFKQRQTMNTSLTPPQSPKFQRIESSVISKVEVVNKQAEIRRESKEEIRKESKGIIKEFTEEIRKEVRRESRNEEVKSKIKLPGLSSLQQKALSLNDEVDDSGFKSLTELPDDSKKSVKPVTKSQSFKTVKPSDLNHNDNKFIINKAMNDKIPFVKAASLDSVKHLDENCFEVKNENKETKDTQSEVKIEETKVSEESKSTILPPNFDLAAEIFNDINNITISGPSHTAVVNVSSTTTDSYNTSNMKTETLTSGEKTKEVTTKESVSVTKIQLKRESTQITQSTVTVPKSAVPEFLNRQLNKVEARPASNVVLSINSPRIIDEQSRPKSIFTLPEQEKTKNVPRKFSQENIEIIEKTEEDTVKSGSSFTVITSVQPQPRFRKNELNKRKSSTSSTTPDSPNSEKPFLRSRSVSLDSLKGEAESSDKSSQDSLDKLDEKQEIENSNKEKSNSIVESVVLRRKSLIKQKNDEEPELMKVFARRSLKLKDTESDALSQQINENNDSKTRDSDKENQADSPQEERKKSITKEFIKAKEPFNESKIIKKQDSFENREPLIEPIKTPTKEPKIKESLTEKKFIEVAEVTLRKPNNNIYTRAFSLNSPKPEKEDKVKKQSSFNERKISESWISNMKNGDDLIERKISQDEIITGISPKSDYITEELITERKNFNQRKAEWEKRAQEAQKKSVP